jgi:hypothetical protein
MTSNRARWEAEVISLRKREGKRLKVSEIWITDGPVTARIPVEHWKRIVADVEKQLAEFPLKV